jgi:hypothetical protein
MQKLDIPNSRHPERTGGPLRAAGFLNGSQGRTSPWRTSLKKLALAVADREAHEALEWAQLDGVPVVEPHGSLNEIEGASRVIAPLLTTAARE